MFWLSSPPSMTDSSITLLSTAVPPLRLPTRPPTLSASSPWTRMDPAA